MAEVLFRARLTRENSSVPWGFRLQGGADFGRPLTLLKVVEESVACKGGLKATDILVKLAGYPADDMTHKDAQEVIIAAGDSLEIIVERAEEEVISPPSSEDDEIEEPEVPEIKKSQNDIKDASRDAKLTKKVAPQKSKVPVSAQLSPSVGKKTPGSPKVTPGSPKVLPGSGASPKTSPALKQKQPASPAAKVKKVPPTSKTPTSVDKKPVDVVKPTAADIKPPDKVTKSVDEQLSVSGRGVSQTQPVIPNGLPPAVNTAIAAPPEKVSATNRSLDHPHVSANDRTLSTQDNSLGKGSIGIVGDRLVQDSMPPTEYVAQKDNFSMSNIPSSSGDRSDQWTASSTTVTVSAPPIDNIPAMPSVTMVSQPTISKPPPPYIPTHAELSSMGRSESVSSTYTVPHAPPPSYDESIAAGQASITSQVHHHTTAPQPEHSLNHQERQELSDTVGQLNERLSPSRRRRTTSNASPDLSSDSESQLSRSPGSDSLYPWRRQKLPETVQAGEGYASEAQPPGEETIAQSIKPSLKLVGKRIEMVQSPPPASVVSQQPASTQQTYVGQDGQPVIVSTAIPQVYVGAGGQQVAFSNIAQPQVYLDSNGRPLSVSAIPGMGNEQLFHVLPVDHRSHRRMRGRRRMSVPDIRSYSRGNDIYYPPQPSDIYFSTADPDLVEIPMPAVKEMVEDLNRRLEVIAAQHPRLAEPTEFGTSYLPKDATKSEDGSKSEKGGTPISSNDLEALKRRIFGAESSAEIKDAYQKIFDIKSPLSSPPPRRKVVSMHEDMLSKQASRRVHFAEPVEASVVEIPRTTRRERRERRREREIEKENANAQADPVSTASSRTVPTVPSAAFVTGSGAERYQLGDHVEIGQDRILVPASAADNVPTTVYPTSVVETAPSQSVTPTPRESTVQGLSLSYVVPRQASPQNALSVTPTQVVTPLPSQAAQPASHVAVSHVTPPVGHGLSPSGHVTPPVLKMTPPPPTQIAPTAQSMPAPGYVPPLSSQGAFSTLPVVTQSDDSTSPTSSPVSRPGSAISVSISRQGHSQPTVFTLPQATPGHPAHFHYTISGRKSTDPMSIQYSYPPTYEESQRIRRGRQRQRSFDDSMLLNRSYFAEPPLTYSHTLQPGQMYGRVSPSYSTPLSPLDTMQSRTLRAMETQAYERSPTGMLSPAYSISSLMPPQADTIQSKSFKALEAHLLPVESRIRQQAPGQPPLRVEVLGIPRQVLQPAAVGRPFVPGAREDYLSPLPSPARSPSPMAQPGMGSVMAVTSPQASSAEPHTPLVPGVFALFDEAFTQKFLQWQNQGRRSHFQSETYKLVHELDENERKYGGTQ